MLCIHLECVSPDAAIFLRVSLLFKQEGTLSAQHWPAHLAEWQAQAR